MKVADYNAHVLETDQYKLRSGEDRRSIAIYGLVGEIGSLLSAVKKKVLAEDGDARWDQPNDEIAEEIGDVVWYSFSLAQISNTAPINILTHDIALLKKEIGSSDERATKIKTALDPTTRAVFLAAADSFPRTVNMCFDDYQKLAFLTARTSGKKLLEVCLAVLWQLGAELLRATLPKIEVVLNTNIVDRPVNTILGEIAWHLAATASLYKLSLDYIVEKNVTKLKFRKQGVPTPLHDIGSKASQQFPRQFVVQFVSIAPGKLRMYTGGKRLGNDLTDNAHDEDGYRFHDILHLSLIAHLGWSPVMRALMKRKRRDIAEIDEVEDGARAQIVEELVIKAIHTEGERLARESGRCDVAGPERMFPSRSVISFKFLKTLHSFVEGLEVEKNTYWEWDNAIFDGAEIFYYLRKEQQGTVVVDLDNRTLTFSPDVCIGLKGAGVDLGMGSASAPDLNSVDQLLSASERHNLSDDETVRVIAAKRAILAALKLPEGSLKSFGELSVKLAGGNRVFIKSTGETLEQMRASLILEFRCAFSIRDGITSCTAMAMADPGDLAK